MCMHAPYTYVCTCTYMYIHTCTYTLCLIVCVHVNYAFTTSLQDVLLEKFAQRRPSCEAYDEKMHFYTGVAAEIDSQPSTEVVEFALLNTQPVACSLKTNARLWVSSLGKKLNDSAREKLTQLKTELEVRGGG